MRHPRRLRNLSGAVTVVSVATFISAFVWRNGAAFDGWFGIVLGALFVMLLSGASFVVCALIAGRQTLLLRGGGVLARWTVSSSEWHQFLMNERTLMQGETMRSTFPSHGHAMV